jgi:hypothetical protein
VQQTSIFIEVDTPLYKTDEFAAAGKAAEDSGKVVYTWSASGRSNWLARGFHVADRLGYVLLPGGLPDYLDMEDDPPDPSDPPDDD